MTDYASIFTERFRGVLKEKKYTQCRLAEDCEVAYQTVSHNATGITMPNAYTLALYCKALNVSADYLLGLKDECERN